MALVVRGRSKCRLCEEVLHDNDEIVAFSAFMVNELDPIHGFSDSAVHKQCFEEDPRRDRVSQCWADWLESVSPGNRICSICTERVTVEPDHLYVSRFTLNGEEPGASYESRHYHINCLKEWDDIGLFLHAIQEYACSSQWKGDYLVRLLQHLRTKGISRPRAD